MGLILSVAPAVAHHSFQGAYFMDRKVTVEGTLVKVELLNPHSMVVIDVRGKDGAVTRWNAEWGCVSELARAGVNATVLKAGDIVRLAGAPGREGASSQLLIETITRPSDGWSAAGHTKAWCDMDLPFKPAP